MGATDGKEASLAPLITEKLPGFAPGPYKWCEVLWCVLVQEVRVHDGSLCC